MSDLFSQWRTAAAQSSGATSAVQLPLNQGSNIVSASSSGPSYDEVISMIDHSFSSLKVYVLESDITTSQNTVKTIVKQATF